MLERLMFLAAYGVADGGALDKMFETWRQIGFFSYLIPFLLIFALIFGILTKANFFNNNKIINAIIALAVGLIAIQFPIVPQFFSIIFPNLGIALAIILVVLIVAGLFLSSEVIKNDKWLNYVLLGIAAIIVVVVLVQTAGTLGWSATQWWLDNWATIVAVLVIVGLIAAVIIGAIKTNPTSPPG